MKKNRIFGKFYSWGHSNSVFNFLKFKFYKCGAFERKENDSENWKKLTFTHDTAIKNGQAHHWGGKIKIYMIYF